LGVLEGARQKAERNASKVPFFFSEDVGWFGLGEGGGIGAAKLVVSLFLSDTTSSFISCSVCLALPRSLSKTSSFLNLVTLANSHLDTLNGSNKLPDEKSHQHLSISLMTVGLLLLPLSSFLDHL
jgi:hypothetical protein